jgi:hypothetical protein
VDGHKEGHPLYEFVEKGPPPVQEEDIHANVRYINKQTHSLLLR